MHSPNRVGDYKYALSLLCDTHTPSPVTALSIDEVNRLVGHIFGLEGSEVAADVRDLLAESERLYEQQCFELAPEADTFGDNALEQDFGG